MRQGANSAVRFTTYTTLKQFVEGNTRPGQALPTSLTFAIGGMAGLVTVYATMPFECVMFLARSQLTGSGRWLTYYLLFFSVIKTRMQSLDARTQYRNSFHCAYRTFTEEGILRFWTGTTPRLLRLVISGGVTFSVYEVCLTYHLFAALKDRFH
jgi:solute carrier family 25 citrate transporter 1